LATHKATCLLEDVPRTRSSSYRRNIAEAKPPTPSVSTLKEAPPPSEPSIQQNVPVRSNLNELNLDDLDDFLDEDMFELPYNESTTYSYNSIDSLVQWIRTVKKKCRFVQ
jgi:hypothetical protein